MTPSTGTCPSRRRRSAAALAAVIFFAACGETPVEPTALSVEPSFSTTTTNQYASGSHVDTWNAIPVVAQDQNTVCQGNPPADLAWTNPHKAFIANGAAFQTDANVTNRLPYNSSDPFPDWINAWPGFEWYQLTSEYGGPLLSGGHNWTRYTTPVSGTGTFDLYLVADNCSWIYLANSDGSNRVLVGAQRIDPRSSPTSPIQYPVALNGDHILEFIVYDAGGQAGGMFLLETSTTTYTDTDGDGLADVSETNVYKTDPNDSDTDDDGTSDGDEVAAGTDPLKTNVVDSDGDGVPDSEDAFPLDATESVDTDGDGIGNNADTDDDGDGYSDADETDNGTDPLDAGSTPPDNDGDFVSDLNDADDDNDSIEDKADNCSLVANTDQADYDGDGQGNACDPDDDNDGVADDADAYPMSNTSATVVVGTCDSGVANQGLASGATFNDLIGSAKDAASNHGQFVNAVSKLADGWKKAGLISGRQQGAIVSCAARSK